MGISDYRNKSGTTGVQTTTVSESKGAKNKGRRPAVRGSDSESQHAKTASSTLFDSASSYSTPPSSPHAFKSLNASIPGVDTSYARALAVDSAHHHSASSASSRHDVFQDALQSPVWGVTIGFSASPSALSLALNALHASWRPKSSDSQKSDKHTVALSSQSSTSNKRDTYASDISIRDLTGRSKNLTASTLVARSGRRFFATNTLIQGGFGKVRFGLDEANQRVAIKMLRMREKPEPEQSTRKHKTSRRKTHVTSQERYHFEVSLMSQLGLLIDVVDDGDKVYVVTPYQEGDTHQFLTEAQSRIETIDEHHALTVQSSVQWLQALLPLYNAGIAHGDVKPPNYLYDKNGRFVASDFGLASRVRGNRRTIDAIAQGTSYYMAPELQDLRQGIKRSITDSVDVWSVGVMMLDCLLLEEHPLYYAVTPEERQEALGDLKQYRQQLISGKSENKAGASDGRARIDVSRIGTIGSAWDASFEPYRDSSGELIAVLLEGLLNPNPAQRVTLPVACAQLQRQHDRLSSTQRSAVEQIWHDAATLVQPDKEHVFAGLAQYVAGVRAAESADDSAADAPAAKKL